MTHKKHADSLGPKSSSKPQKTQSNASEDEELKRASAVIGGLTIEELEAEVRRRGMENDPDVQHSLQGIRRGTEVEALKRAFSENREPTVVELEAAVLETGMEKDPEVVRKLAHIRDSDKVIKASELMIEAYALLRDLQESGGKMEIEAVQGFLEMAELAIDGLGECSEQSTISLAEMKTSWPVMVEGNAAAALKAARADLKKIKLGTRNSSDVRTHAVLTAASRHKFVVSLLYWTVQAMFNFDRLSRIATGQEKRLARLKDDMVVKYKMLMRLVNGYEANDRRPEDLQQLGEKLKSLHACPQVNAASFNEWFGACLALLDCITRSEFYLPRYKLRNLGRARAKQREGVDGKKDSDYRDGISGALRSALKTVLKINRKKEA